MKVLIGLVCLMLVVSVAYGLTAEEETFVGQLLQNKQKLIELYQRSTALSTIADNLSSEALPIELTILRNERTAIIATRDAEVDGIKSQMIIDVNAKIAEYDSAINTKDGEINAKIAEIEALTP